MSERIHSVGAITRRIQDDLGGYGPILVRGELSQARIVASGHFYGTLKDREAVISLVCWRSTVARLGKIPREGEEVVVRGSLDVYGPRGQYQLLVNRFQQVGQGDLAQRFEQLKARLTAEGLFDDERKRPLPFLPQGVGIATADGSAALADMMDSIGERFPDMIVAHAPCLVQGHGAAASIVAAIESLEADPDVDVIIVGRGGGSLEDLWAFNEEPVVRAIAACSKPVVSAVGHETDVTLADFVADLRAKTPTMAGELVVPVQADLAARIEDLALQLDEAVDELLWQARNRLQALAQHRALATPGHQLAVRVQRLDELTERLQPLGPAAVATAREQLAACERELYLARPAAKFQELEAALPTMLQRLNQALSNVQAQAEQRFIGQCQRLDAYSPLGVIARGYSVVHGPDGTPIHRVAQAPAGTALEARVSDGWIQATVTGGRDERLAEASDFYRVETTKEADS